MKPEWEKLGTQMSVEESKYFKVGKVDCTCEKELCKEFSISGYPSVLLYAFYPFFLLTVSSSNYRKGLRKITKKNFQEKGLPKIFCNGPSKTVKCTNMKIEILIKEKQFYYSFYKNTN